MPVPCEVGEVLTHLPTRREASQVVRLSGESPTSPLASLRWRTAFSVAFAKPEARVARSLA